MKIWGGNRPESLYRPYKGLVCVYHGRGNTTDFFDDYIVDESGPNVIRIWDYGYFCYKVEVPQP